MEKKRKELTRGNRTAAVLLLLTFSVVNASEEITVNVNLKKPVGIVSDKFLSITLDPDVLFKSYTLRDVRKSTSMARALSPAYLRLAGESSNRYSFESNLYPNESTFVESPKFTDSEWKDMNQWAENSGLEVIATLPPSQSNSTNAAFYDSRNALELVSYSDHMGFNTSWQIGYECQTRCGLSGKEVGLRVNRLRDLLNFFPRYEKAIVVGPDIITFKARKDQKFLKEFFETAANDLSAITWHPEFNGVTVDENGVSMLQENLSNEKDNLYSILGLKMYKKPLWIAESKSEQCKEQFLGALVWTRRLGDSAKLGFEVLMRQTNESYFSKPTPDYWVSVLHKTLVGREVLDTKITAGNRTHVQFYSHCTRPSDKYGKGSVTVFGINLTPARITTSLKGIKVKVVHKYILLPGYDADNRMFAESVLLNNEELNLIDNEVVPELKPAIQNTDKETQLHLPSGGIGFWVLTDLKVKACMGDDNEYSEKNSLRRLNKNGLDPLLNKVTEKENLKGLNSLEIFDSSEEENSFSTQQQRRSTINNNLKKNRGENEKRKRYVEKKDTLISKNIKDYDEFESTSSEQSDNSKENYRIKLHPEEIIRSKINKYKKQLMELENENKQCEPSEMSSKRYIEGKHAKGLDTEKVIEALILITKIENAVKDLQKETGEGSENDGLEKYSYWNSSENDMLLNEVLNTRESQNINIPTQIEDQLNALYTLLSEEKREVNNKKLLRQRRNVNRVDECEPRRKRLRTIRNGLSKLELPKQRRLEQNRLRVREKQGLKRTRSELRDDDDHNISYIFPKRKPLPNFPRGTVFLQPGYEQPEAFPRKVGLNYVNDFQTQGRKKKWKRSDNARQDYNDYEPLTSIAEIADNEDNIDPAATANHSDETDDPKDLADKPQEMVSRNVASFYGVNPRDESNYYEEPKTRQESQDPDHKTYSDLSMLKRVNQHQSKFNFSPSSLTFATRNTYDRLKRHVNNLEELLNEEMISEDDNNNRDCQCRVIRENQNCKYCNKYPSLNLRRPQGYSEQIQGYLEKSPIERRYRFRRQVTELETPLPELVDVLKNTQPKDGFLEFVTTTKPQVNINNHLFLGPEFNNTFQTKTIITDHKRTSYSNNSSQNIGPSTESEIKIANQRIGENQFIQTQSAQNQSSAASTQSSNSNQQRFFKTESLEPQTSNKIAKRIEQTVSTTLKNRRFDAEVKNEFKIEDDAANTKKVVRNIDNQTYFSGINNSMLMPKITNTTHVKTGKNIEKSIPKLQHKNITAKVGNYSKSVQSSSATRAAALSALTKENESKREQKQIEMSIKRIEGEKAKLAEYQKKRDEQLQRLKTKLRAKRERLIENYKDELLEAINQSRVLTNSNDQVYEPMNEKKSSDILLESQHYDRQVPERYDHEIAPQDSPESILNYQDSDAQVNQFPSNVRDTQEPNINYDPTPILTIDADSSQNRDPYDTDSSEIESSDNEEKLKLIKRSNARSIEPDYSTSDDRDPELLMHEYLYPYQSDFHRHKRDIEMHKRNEPLSDQLELGKSDSIKNQLDRKKKSSNYLTRRKRNIEDLIYKRINAKVDKKQSLIKLKHKKVFKANNSNDNPKLKTFLQTEKALQNKSHINNTQKQFMHISNREKRSIKLTEVDSIDPLSDNYIHHSHNLNPNDVWQSFLEMKKDAALLKQIDKRIHNKNELNGNLTTIKPVKATTQTNIESLIIEAIPKIHTVITGGLKKAENLTGTIEDLIENFDEQYVDTTENIDFSSLLPESTETHDERLSKNVFQSVTGSIKKIFGFFSNMANVFVH